MDCEGYMAALAHNVLKMVRRLGHCAAPLGQRPPALDATGGMENTPASPLPDTYSSPSLTRRFSGAAWLSQNIGLSFS